LYAFFGFDFLLPSPYSSFALTGLFGVNMNFYPRRCDMADSTYVIIELVGTSTESWEDAAKNALKTASKSVKELRVAEVTKLDMTLDKGKVTAYRARITVSFKYLKGDL
jgi:flavin-binding protein dodecin